MFNIIRIKSYIYFCFIFFTIIFIKNINSAEMQVSVCTDSTDKTDPTVIHMRLISEKNR
ncbi:MAG: hypothetical protein HQK51_09325, partial [Oligoflexia bacterium]|nr:hypothetical protein [Oligoflexia bacterium]